MRRSAVVQARAVAGSVRAWVLGILGAVILALLLWRFPLISNPGTQFALGFAAQWSLFLLAGAAALAFCRSTTRTFNKSRRNPSSVFSWPNSRSPRVTTMSRSLDAGFYSDQRGPLPFAFGVVPGEKYYILRFR